MRLRDFGPDLTGRIEANEGELKRVQAERRYLQTLARVRAALHQGGQYE
jgi:hypothetical protein